MKLGNFCLANGVEKCGFNVSIYLLTNRRKNGG